MQFTYTPEQQELRDRASRLTDAIIPFEEPCEAGRGLPDEALAEIRQLTLEHQLNAINMPVEWGGQGLSVLDQVIVSERSASSPTHCGTRSGVRPTRCATARRSSASAT